MFQGSIQSTGATAVRQIAGGSLAKWDIEPIAEVIPEKTDVLDTHFKFFIDAYNDDLRYQKYLKREGEGEEPSLQMSMFFQNELRNMGLETAGELPEESEPTISAALRRPHHEESSDGGKKRQSPDPRLSPNLPAG